MGAGQHPRPAPPDGALNWAPPSGRAAHPLPCTPPWDRPHQTARRGPQLGPIRRATVPWHWTKRQRPHQASTLGPSAGPHQQGDAHRLARPNQARARSSRLPKTPLPQQGTSTQPPADQRATAATPHTHNPTSPAASNQALQQAHLSGMLPHTAAATPPPGALAVPRRQRGKSSRARQQRARQRGGWAQKGGA